MDVNDTATSISSRSKLHLQAFDGQIRLSTLDGFHDHISEFLPISEGPDVYKSEHGIQVFHAVLSAAADGHNFQGTKLKCLHGSASETPSILPGHIEARFCTFRFPVPDMMRFVCGYGIHHFFRTL